MAAGLSIAGTRKYVPLACRDLPEGQQPVYILGTLDSYQSSEVSDALMHLSLDAGTGITLDRISPTASHIAACRHGIKGWNDLVKDRRGKVIPFLIEKTRIGGVPYEVVSHESLRHVELATLSELAVEIRNDNALTEEEAGKSVAVPTQ